MTSFKYRTMINHLQELWLQNKMQIFIMGKLNYISKNKAGGGANVRLLIFLYFRNIFSYISVLIFQN